MRLRNLPRLLAGLGFSCALSLSSLLSLTVAGAEAGAPVAAARPNIVLILADDLGFSDIGPYGGEIRTPSLDRLAAEGLRFTQFYNCAKCTTTRASILTGLHPRQGKKGSLLRQSMVTVAEVLRSAGYRTSLSGKWHLGAVAPRRPIDRGFEEFYGLLDGCSNYFDPSQPDPEYKGGRVRIFAHNETRIHDFPGGFYTTDAFTDHAVGMIRKYSAEGKPFFVHVCYTAPHYPLHALPEDIARYEGKYSGGWYELRQERHRRQIDLGIVDAKWKLALEDPAVEPWEKGRERPYAERRMEVYAAMVDRLDQGIGRILRAIDEAGVRERTLVLFLADNGGCAELPEGRDFPHPPGPKEHYTSVGPGWGWAQNAPFRRYKSWVHEGGIATPLICRWPGRIAAGTLTGQVGHIIDILPTCAEVAGAVYPESVGGRRILPLEGKSLLPVLEGRRREPHESLSWYWAGSRAIRQGKWKLVWDVAYKRWELYDMEADRTELHDLAASEQDRVRVLADAWLAWARETEVEP